MTTSPTTSDIAWIVGNGTSRRGFDLERIKDTGVVYGCNALYRDYKTKGYILPHYLVAIDPGIITEIESSDFPSSRVIIPSADEQFEPAEVNRGRPRSNAGVNAMIEAIRREAKTLICVGFDFLQPEEAQSTSNFYEGSANYGPETRASVMDNFGRTRYLKWLTDKNSEVNFFFAYPQNDFTLRINGSNIFHITFSQILENLNA